MILFFDLNKLEQYTAGNNEYLVVALQKFYLGRTIPKNAREKYKPIPQLTAGSSCLLNPEPLFSDTRTETIFKAQYIKLAGRRNYLDYKVFQEKSLDLTLYTDINLAAIKYNNLLTAQNNRLLFKYEEKHGT